MSLTPDENKLMTELLRKVKPLLKTFRPAKVVDNQDPQMLGRIRCVPEQINEQDLQNSVYNFNPKKINGLKKTLLYIFHFYLILSIKYQSLTNMSNYCILTQQTPQIRRDIMFRDLSLLLRQFTKKT